MQECGASGYEPENEDHRRGHENRQEGRPEAREQGHDHDRRVEEEIFREVRSEAGSQGFAEQQGQPDRAQAGQVANERPLETTSKLRKHPVSPLSLECTVLLMPSASRRRRSYGRFALYFLLGAVFLVGAYFARAVLSRPFPVSVVPDGLLHRWPDCLHVQGAIRARAGVLIGRRHSSTDRCLTPRLAIRSGDRAPTGVGRSGEFCDPAAAREYVRATCPISPPPRRRP